MRTVHILHEKMLLFALLMCWSVFVSVRQAGRLYYSYKLHTIQLWNENKLTWWMTGAEGRAEERWCNSPAFYLPVCVDLVRMSHNGGNQTGKTEECTACRIVKMGRKTENKLILTVEGSDWEGRRKRGVQRGKRGGQGRERKEGGAARGRSHMRLLHCSISSVSKSLSLLLCICLSGLLSQQDPRSNSFSLCVCMGWYVHATLTLDVCECVCVSYRHLLEYDG